MSSARLAWLRDLPATGWVGAVVVALWLLVAVFGPWLAFTAYAWLLQNAPISRVATYAYVNPMVAIVLGYVILDELITPVTLVGAAIIVVSVALVTRIETARQLR